MASKKKDIINEKPEATKKRDRLKELQEHRFDKKMVEFVADEMKNWIDFAFSSQQERIRIAAIVIKACQEYKESKTNSSSICEQADAILAMANKIKG